IETRFERPAALPDRLDGIIVLGGPEELKRMSVHGIPHLNEAGERFTEFVALSRRYPNAKLVFAGGYGFIGEFPLAGADLARELFEDLGLEAGRVVFESQSRNTRENAVFAKALVKPEPGETWLLVTSALHMTRSVGIFRQVDWPVIPWPVDYRYPSEAAGYPRFSVADGLDDLDNTVREMIGLVYYRLQGWTDALVPGPTN
ncbi:MAG: YdcF family protein, partial [Pseudomonadota bacterium]